MAKNLDKKGTYKVHRNASLLKSGFKSGYTSDNS